MLKDVMIPAAFEEDIERAIKILKDAGCTEIYLFGSVAEGQVRDRSDVDLAVRGCPVGDYLRLWSRLSSALEHEVDLVDLDHAIDFARYLEEEGDLVRLA